MKLFAAIAFVGAIWDLVTSFTGTFAIMEVDNNSLYDLLDNAPEFIISIIVCLVITVFDYILIDSVSQQTSNRFQNQWLKYLFPLGWFFFKLYDLWTAFLGTADVWFAEKLVDYGSVDLGAIFEVTTFGQRLVLLMICLVISACPMYLCWYWSSNNS